MPFLAFPICLSGFPGEFCATFGCFLGHRATPLINTRQPESLPRLKGSPQVMMRMTNMDPRTSDKQTKIGESGNPLCGPHHFSTPKFMLLLSHRVKNPATKNPRNILTLLFHTPFHSPSPGPFQLRLLRTRADHKGKTPENTHTTLSGSESPRNN